MADVTGKELVGVTQHTEVGPSSSSMSLSLSLLSSSSSSSSNKIHEEEEEEEEDTDLEAGPSSSSLSSSNKIHEEEEEEDTDLEGVTMSIKIELDPGWVTSIQQKHLRRPTLLKTSSASISCSIHRVPRGFGQHEPDAYSPGLISIGPIYWNRRTNDLKTIEEHKWRYLHDILSRQDCLEQCLVAVKEVEERARECYSMEINLNSNTFVEMMVLDGCFLIELFRIARKQEYKDDDTILKCGWIKRVMTADLLMLENQIPFFILLILCNVMNIAEAHLIEWACSFFDVPFFDIPDHASMIQHLLHLLHYRYSRVLKSRNENRNHDSHVEMIPTASKLKEAGIKFKKGDGNGFLDITFREGVIEIPPLKVEHTTNALFMNLVAFEQLYRHCNSYFAGSYSGSYFAGYTYFMDCLIDTVKDVEILCDNGIIDRRLSSYEDVATLFNNLGREIVVYDEDYYHLFDVCKKINQYYRNTWRKWRTILMLKYFNNPWAIISVIAAIVLLLFTFAQTFFSAFPKFAY